MVNIISVRIIIVIAKIINLDSKALDFVLAFPQADLEEDIWIQLPIGFQVSVQTEVYSKSHYILKLNKNVYGLKKRIYNWYKKLKKSLVDQGFNPSYIYPCLYIGNFMIVLT